MDRAAPSRSRSSRAAIGIVLAVLFAGCSAAPPPLPPDTTSLNRSRSLSLADFAEADRGLSCEEIAAERQRIAQGMQADTDRIEANRTRNQVAGYFGALFLVPYLATDNNDAEKAQIAKLYERQDTLIQLAAIKGCAMSQ